MAAIIAINKLCPELQSHFDPSLTPSADVPPSESFPSLSSPSPGPAPPASESVAVADSVSVAQLPTSSSTDKSASAEDIELDGKEILRPVWRALAASPYASGYTR